MNVYTFTILFIAWYTLSLVVSERWGKKMKIGEEWSFFICMMFSPVIGYAVTMLMGKKEEAAG